MSKDVADNDQAGRLYRTLNGVYIKTIVVTDPDFDAPVEVELWRSDASLEDDVRYLTTDVERLQDELEATRGLLYSLIIYLSPDKTWEQNDAPLSAEEASDLIKVLYQN